MKTSLFLLLFLSGCSNPPLEVFQFHLRGEQTLANRQVPMIRGEAQYRLDQNLSAKERKNKFGQYYVIKWKDKVLDENSDTAEILFQYRQAATGKSVQSKRISLSSFDKNKVEISIIGNDYLKKGRVLSWKASLIQNGNLRASEQSFLWD